MNSNGTVGSALNDATRAMSDETACAVCNFAPSDDCPREHCPNRDRAEVIEGRGVSGEIPARLRLSDTAPLLPGSVFASDTGAVR